MCTKKNSMSEGTSDKLTEVSTTGAAFSDKQESMMVEFLDMMDQFLVQLKVLFPECAETQRLNDVFNDTFDSSNRSSEDRKVSAKQAVERWSQVMRPLFSRFVSKDDSAIEELSQVPELSGLDIIAKWNSELHPTTRDNIFMYLTELTQLCNVNTMYNTAPSNLMNAVFSMANNLTQQLQAGELDLNNLNVMGLAEDIMQQVDEDEIQNFAQNITQGGSDMSQVQDMFSMASQMMNGLGGNGVDLSALLGQRK